MQTKPTVGSLPIELWGAVFALLELRWDIVCVTHVCCSWRTFALLWPNLWCELNLLNTRLSVCADMLEALLPRSRGVPIALQLSLVLDPVDIPFHFMMQKRQAVRRLLTEHMHHVRSLRLNGAVQEIVRDALLVPAPVLETLSFREDAITAPSSCTLPERLFAGEAPKLQTLDLGCNYLPETCTALANIATLHVGAASREDKSMYSVLPRMTTLYLRDLRQMPKQPNNRTLSHVELASSTLHALKLLDHHNIHSLYIDEIGPDNAEVLLAVTAGGTAFVAVSFSGDSAVRCDFKLSDGRRRVIRRMDRDTFFSPSFMGSIKNIRELSCPERMFAELTAASSMLERCPIFRQSL